MSKLAVITGADGGMGKEITRAVAEAGYHVIMLCYTLFKGEERKNQMILETGNKEIEVRQVDLSSMASVINVADGLLGRGKHIDLLMNNAGTMSTHLMQTEDGLERTVAVNYVAYITKCLSELGINIAFMRLFRESKGNTAYTIVESDDLVPEDIADTIRRNKNVYNVMVVQM